MLLGDDFFAWVMLAFGGALLVGNVMALVHPPQQAKTGELAQAPKVRTVVMASIGGVITIWAVATLLVS